MPDRFEFAIETAQRAGDLTLKYFGQKLDVLSKEDLTPVTAADRATEEFVREAISKEFPVDAVFGEEFGGGDSANRWVVDPIDGTKSFICGVPLFATLLSYEADGVAEFGVAHFPALGETVAAKRGFGCMLNGVRCTASTSKSLNDAAVAIGSLATAEHAGRFEGIMRLARSVRTMRTWCDAYGHCLVATGRIEAMIDPRVAAWDISAIAPIVEESGAKFVDFGGNSNPVGEAISVCPLLFDEVLRAFK